MNYFVGLLVGLLLGAIAAGIATQVAYPHPSNNGFSLGPLLIYILPVISSCISIPAYVVAMLVRPSKAKTPDEKRHPVSGALVAASTTLIASCAFWALMWHKR